MSDNKICNQQLIDSPFCFGINSPATLFRSSPDHSYRIEQNADQCIIDNKYFYLRGHIEIPIIDYKGMFTWSTWVSVSEKSFSHISEHWDTPGREKGEPYFGWLTSKLPVYPDTLHLAVSVKTQPVGQVPLIHLMACSHPLYRDQFNGIHYIRAALLSQQIQGNMIHMDNNIA